MMKQSKGLLLLQGQSKWASGSNHFASNTINVSILHHIYLMEEDNISGESFCFKYKEGNTWLHEIVFQDEKHCDV